MLPALPQNCQSLLLGASRLLSDLRVIDDFDRAKNTAVPSALPVRECETRALLRGYQTHRRRLPTVSAFAVNVLCSALMTERDSIALALLVLPFSLLSFYQNAADLHIGVTDSNGEVFEFDKNGVHAGTKSHSWQQSLVIPIVAEQSSSWREYWDYTLHIASEMENWTSDKYAQDGNNCYSFVLAFLKMLQVKDLKPSLTSKTQFCKDFLVPRTKNAAKYIALYRQVIKEGVAVISVH